MEYWKIPHHGTQKIDYVQSSAQSYVDWRWQADLEEQVQAGIMQIPDINHYLRGLALSVETDGLSAAGSIL